MYSLQLAHDGVELDAVSAVYDKLGAGGVAGVGRQIVCRVCYIRAYGNVTDGGKSGGHVLVEVGVLLPSVGLDHSGEHGVYSDAVLTEIES